MSGQTADQLQQAAALLQRGAVNEAQQTLADLIAREPNNGDAYGLLGIALAQQQQFAAAAEALQRSLQAKPDHPGAHANYANVLKRLGRLEEAAHHARRAI